MHFVKTLGKYRNIFNICRKYRIHILQAWNYDKKNIPKHALQNINCNEAARNPQQNIVNICTFFILATNYDSTYPKNTL